MTGDIDEPDDKAQVEEDSAKEVAEDDIDLTADDDIIGESTAEIKVDELVAKIDAEDGDEAARHREIKQKIEALREQRDDEFGSTYNFNLDDEL